MRYLLLLLAAMLLLPIPTAQAGGGGGHGACRGLTHSTRVLLLDNCFDGTAQIVDIGRTVTVVNQGEMPHTYTAVDSSFDSGTLQPGESARIDVPRSGTFPVYCTLHSSPDGEGMAGVLVMGEEPGDASPAAVAVPPLAGFGAGLVLSALAARFAQRARRSDARGLDNV